jgi:hypothetical protein
MRSVRPDSGRLLAKLAAEVEREMGGDPEAREVIAEGVADAVAGRRPRW